MALMREWYEMGRWMTGALPKRRCRWLADRLADWHWSHAPAEERRAVSANLSVILGEPVDEDSPLVRSVFHHFGYYLTEFLGAHRPDGAPIVEGCDALARALRAERGAMVLSAHIGNWEVGGAVLARMGFPTHVVALPHRDPRVNAFFDEQRARCGVGVVPLGPRATRHSMDLLRAGEVLGILGDREFGDNGITVSLFGRQALVPRGPAVLSLRTGAPVIPIFFIREAPGQFRFYVEPAIRPPAPMQNGGAVPHAVQALTQRYTDRLAAYIKRFPTQWVVFQPFENREWNSS